MRDARQGRRKHVSRGCARSTASLDPETVLHEVVDSARFTFTLPAVAEAVAGYALLLTGEPDEAARLVRTDRPHLVFLDLMLPGRGGVEFMREVPEIADLSIIFISGYGSEETIMRARLRQVLPTISSSCSPLRSSPR